ncbi:HAD family hydrolase [Calidifontibacillus oryziterrae]|uniref:HAD family hydrolase n=1 Tax=Calidifontibacillus oryziterrae TaxID=1191699 RepID=UPI0002D4D126|nr:HAD family hydrolase [Calidifontibacillus oryziterrae]
MNWGCVCLDLDNTLIDYEAAFKKGMHYTFHHFFDGNWSQIKPADKDEWFPVFKKQCNELFDNIKLKNWSKQEYQQIRFIKSLQYFQIEITPEMAWEFQSYFYSIVHLFVEPFQSAPLLLNKLSERNIPFGLITNGRTYVQKNKLKALNFERWFSPENIFISQEYGVAKPNSKLFEIAHHSLNKSTSSPSLYIGDSWELDVVGAINAGWDAIYLNSREKVPTTNHQPLQTCRTLNEVIEVLGKEIIEERG